jgi:hypothetical protein
MTKIRMTDCVAPCKCARSDFEKTEKQQDRRPSCSSRTTADKCETLPDVAASAPQERTAARRKAARGARPASGDNAPVVTGMIVKQDRRYRLS